MFARVCRYSIGPLLIMLALAGYRLSSATSTQSLPSPQLMEAIQTADAPTPITPRYNLSQLATDDQVLSVLQRVMPPEGTTKTNTIIHALRLWGPQAEFGTSQRLSGAQMRDYFLDDRVYRQIAPPGAPPLFEIHEGEVRVHFYRQDDPFVTSSSFHTADLLATMGEIGLPTDTIIKTRHGETTVGELLRSTMRRYQYDQFEYEWSTISYGRYLFPLQRFENKYGETITLDGMLQKVVRNPFTFGPCNGTHRWEALAVINRADESLGGLRPQQKELILNKLRQISAILVAAQSPEGYWTRNWPRGVAASEEKLDNLYDGILVTGHHLEWMAFAPESVLPPRETLVRASQWLVRAMLEEEQESLDRAYGPCSHGARALCLWRGKEAWDFYQQH